MPKRKRIIDQEPLDVKDEIMQILKDEAQRLSILEATPVPFAIYDNQQNIIYLNSAFIQTFGYTLGEISTVSEWRQKAYPDTTYQQWVAKKWNKNLEKAKTENKPFEPLELNITCKNGSVKTVMASASPLGSSLNNIYLVTLINITKYKEKEEELAAVSKEFQDITNAVNESSLVSIADTHGNILKINKRFCELSGYPEEELIGQNHRIVNSKYHDKSFWKEMWQTISSGKVWRGEIKNQAKDESEYWVFSIINPILNSEGAIINYLSIRRDITERKRIEFELAAQTELLERTGEMAHIGGWELDLTTFRVTFSRETARIHEVGYPYEPLHLSQGDEFYPPEAWPRVKSAVEAAIKNGTPYDFEAPFITAKGKRIWVSSQGFRVMKDGKPSKLQGTFQDITERKNAEAAAQEIMIRWTLAARAGNVGVWDYYILENKLIWDSQMYVLYGIESENFSGAYEAWRSGLHPDDMERGDLEVQLALKEKQEFNTEFRIVWPDSSIHYIRALATVIRDSEEKAIRMVGTNWDITEQKLTEIALKQAKEEAEKASSAKTEFLTNMSHELRTPLNAVIGFTQLLKETPLNPIQQEYVDSTNISGHSLLEVINDILDFSRIEAGMVYLETHKTNMLELLNNCYDIVKYSASRKRLELFFNIDSSIPKFAMTNPIRLKQVLINLLSNAIKFTGKGKVEIKVVFENLDNEKGKFTFFVSDTGIGISEEHRKKLFKAFSQADTSITRKYGGTGLGLIISEMIVQKLGGTIQCGSKEGEGSTFWFEFISDIIHEENSENEEVAIVKTSLPINLERSVKILIAEDVELNMMLTKAILKKIMPDAQLFEAVDGLEALKQFETIQPDIIFMDIQMPEMDGIEATKEIRKREQTTGNHLSIIALTAGALEENRDRCFSAGMDYFLTKPIDAEKIKIVLNKFLVNKHT